MANTYTQMYFQIVFALWGRANIITEIHRNGIGEMSPLRGFLWVGVMPLLQRLGREAARIRISGIFLLLNFSQL
jgi:hypothetical protein